MKRLLLFSFLAVYIVAMGVFGVLLGRLMAGQPGSRPAEALTRAEAAPMLVDVYVAAVGSAPLVPDDCPFTDISDLPRSQRDAVCQLWGLGVVVGTERDVKYSPELPFATWAEFYLANLGDAIVRDR